MKGINSPKETLHLQIQGRSLAENCIEWWKTFIKEQIEYNLSVNISQVVNFL